ncbi:hypothetical protein LXL04_000534 [Taraxacum kok-saghyz]
MFHGTLLSGFGWNSETHLIEADDEVWANLINSKPEAILFKTKKSVALQRNASFICKR